MRAWLNLTAGLTLVVTTAGSALGQDSLSAARDLYAGAAYEDALVLLNRLRAAAERADDARAIEQYRAFCLLALGRAADAERAIEAVIAAEPSYQPSDAEVSPRVRTAFTDVRRRMLPTIAQQRYAHAKANYDRKDYKAAATEFQQVLEVLADPDLAAAAGQPPLSDIRTLAAGFRDLSVIAAAPPPPPPAPVAAPAPPAQPKPPRIYGPGDPNVVPPIPARQALPDIPIQNGMIGTQGSIEVVINETGAVESVVMKAPISPGYDRQAVAAARGWLYKPATVGGVPVKFRKTIQIALKR